MVAAVPRVEARQAKSNAFAELERAVEAEVVSHGGVSSGHGPTITSAPEHKFAAIVLVKDGKLFLKESGRDFELTRLGRERPARGRRR